MTAGCVYSANFLFCFSMFVVESTESALASVNYCCSRNWWSVRRRQLSLPAQRLCLTGRRRVFCWTSTARRRRVRRWLRAARGRWAPMNCSAASVMAPRRPRPMSCRRRICRPPTDTSAPSTWRTNSVHLTLLNCEFCFSVDRCHSVVIM